MRAVPSRSGASGPNRIRRLLESMRKSESDAVVRERRAAQRTPFVRPVEITLGRQQQAEIQATSSNLSQMGICMIHDVPLETGRTGVLTIHRLHGPPTRVRAEVRWCQPFCDSWYASGWRFIAEEPN